MALADAKTQAQRAQKTTSPQEAISHIAVAIGLLADEIGALKAKIIQLEQSAERRG